MGRRLNEDKVREKLTEEQKSIPEFKTYSLSEYCELTDIIRQLWAKQAKDRFRAKDRLPGPKGYVGEILPWFRGARDAQHTLTPSLARDWRRYYALYDRIFDLEEYYYDRFTRFGRPFLGSTLPNDEIEWNYIMRHHSIPSRLLDWTKGSLIALSYATQTFSDDLDLLGRFRLLGADHDHGETPVDLKSPYYNVKDAVVWMLEPRRLMETTTQCLYPHPIRNIASRRRKVQGMRRDLFKDTKLIEETLIRHSKRRSFASRRKDMSFEKELSNPDLWHKKEYWKYPLPLIPSHISARVGSHLSRFTLHSLSSFVEKPGPPPEKDDGMDCFAKSAFQSDTFWYLVKIVLPADRLHTISRVLRMTGVADMNLTQDLDGLSRELKLRAALGYLDDQEDGQA